MVTKQINKQLFNLKTEGEDEKWDKCQIYAR